MADTGTINALADADELSVAEPNSKPDRGKSLALAAVDEGMQEQVKHLYAMMGTALVTDPQGAAAAMDRAREGVAHALKAWLMMRKMIAGGDA